MPPTPSCSRVHTVWSHPLHTVPCPPLPAFVTRLFSWVERRWNRGGRLRRRRSAGEKSRGSERSSCRGWCRNGPRPTTLIWPCRRPTRANSKNSGKTWPAATCVEPPQELTGILCRRQELQRRREYQQEIKEMQRRVMGRPLLLEQVAQVTPDFST